MPTIITLPLIEELVPVREAQKNITKYFEKGITRITKNGKSLGYLISDKALAELIEDVKSSNPAFLERMEAIKKKSTKTIPLKGVMKEYNM